MEFCELNAIKMKGFKVFAKTIKSRMPKKNTKPNKLMYLESFITRREFYLIKVPLSSTTPVVYLTVEEWYIFHIGKFSTFGTGVCKKYRIFI